MAAKTRKRRPSDAEKVRQFKARKGRWYTTAPIEEVLRDLKRLRSKVERAEG